MSTGERKRRKIFFLTPDVDHPTGGVTIIYDFVNTLCAAGFDAYVLHQTRKYMYQYKKREAPVRYSLAARPIVKKRIESVRDLGRYIYEYARALKYKLQSKRQKIQALAEAEITSDDLIVIPEIYLNCVPELFPGCQKVLLTQNPFLLLWEANKGDAKKIAMSHKEYPHIATSEICYEAAKFYGAQHCFHVPLHIETGLAAPEAIKEKVIAYMPRKRRRESEAVMGVLQQMDKVKGYKIEKIVRKPYHDVLKVLDRALIFVSFSENEGFGLPPAEAMAAECVVVGYTGHGGDEFFDQSTGVPVSEGNSIALMKAIEDVVKEYEADPARLDAMRKNAAEQIRRNYSEEKMRTALLAAFETILEHKGEA